MKRVPLFPLLTVFAMLFSAAAFAQGSMGDSTKSSSSSSAEEKKETPAQEKAEDKAEAKAAKHHHAAKMAAVDLNSATKEDLTKVPGITDEIADKIIAGRPYKSRGELVSKSVVTKAEYAKFRGHVMVKKMAAAAASSK